MWVCVGMYVWVCMYMWVCMGGYVSVGMYGWLCIGSMYSTLNTMSLGNKRGSSSLLRVPTY